MKNLKITLVQSELFWEDRERNLVMFSKLLTPLKRSQTDLILLPEMFTSGFTMNAKKVADTMTGPAILWMKKIAHEKNAVVCGSAVITEKGKYYNRLLWVSPVGDVLHYDKRHLFRMAKEHNTYSAGKKRIIVEWKGWKICPLICYDLRFPVWSRNSNEYDLLIYVANWPTARRNAWNQLLIARAMENQCYLAGVNRVGSDDKGINYSGESVVLDAYGEKVKSLPRGKAVVETVALNWKLLAGFRKKFPVMMDADQFKIVGAR